MKTLAILMVLTLTGCDATTQLFRSQPLTAPELETRERVFNSCMERSSYMSKPADQAVIESCTKAARNLSS